MFYYTIMAATQKSSRLQETKKNIEHPDQITAPSINSFKRKLREVNIDRFLTIVE